MNINLKVVYWACSAAMGGFLFGFDTAVISGVELTLKNVWNLSLFENGLTVSIALIGTVIGALIGGISADKFGRRICLFVVANFFLISALGSAYSIDWFMFLLFRLLGGIGVGVSSVVGPLYIAEIAPPDLRGRLVALFQLNVVFGILMSYLSNFIFSSMGENAWRWMLGVQSIPSFIFLLMVLGIPESPRWLILKKNKINAARNILIQIAPDKVEEVIKGIQGSLHKKTSGIFKLAAFKNSILLVILFAVFNQLSGINAIIYYAPRIFKMAGLGRDAAFLSTIGVGLVNLVSTLLSLSMIDKFGRKYLMKIGSIGLIVSLLLISIAFFYPNFGGKLVPIYLFMFIGFFAFSQGAVIWVFISEIFPNELRAHGQSIGSFTHWACAAITSFSFPYIAETFGGGITFLFFAVIMFLQLLFVQNMMPETKGISLEDESQFVLFH